MKIIRIDISNLNLGEQEQQKHGSDRILVCDCYQIAVDLT